MVLLPGCNCCGGGECGCGTGELPETVSVSISGPRPSGFSLLGVSIDSCFGGGATAVAEGVEVNWPNVVPGPLQAVRLIDRGQGYAQIGRVEPSVSVQNEGTSPATLEVILRKEADECNRDYWAVDSVAVVNGGDGFLGGENAVFAIADGDTEDVAATAYFVIDGDLQITATVPGKSGTEFTVTIATNEDQTLRVESVSASGDSNVYLDGDSISFSVQSPRSEVRPAVAVVRTTRIKPAANAYAASESGLGASMKPVFTQSQYDWNGRPWWAAWSVDLDRQQPTLTATVDGGDATFLVGLASNGDDPPTWRVSGAIPSGTTSGYADGASLWFSGPSMQVVRNAVAHITADETTGEITGVVIDDGGEYYGLAGGTGYAVGDPVYLYAIDGVQIPEFPEFSAQVTSVDDAGAITGIGVSNGSGFYKDSGVVSGVEVLDGGEYLAEGPIASVIVTGGGVYFREDATQPAYVSDINVNIVQSFPSNGTGCVINAVVDDDPSSESFGAILDLVLVDGGAGYAGYLYGGICNCDWVADHPSDAPYTFTAYRVQNESFLATAIPSGISPQLLGCSYVGYRCWGGSTPRNVLSLPANAEAWGTHVWLQWKSPLNVLYFYARMLGPYGVPGEGEGPLTGVWLTYPYSVEQYISQLGRFALPGRLPVMPTKILPGGHTISCTMIEVDADGFSPYWRVDSVSVPNGIDGYEGGQEVLLYAPECSVGATPYLPISDANHPVFTESLADSFSMPRFVAGLPYLAYIQSISPERRFATAVAVVDENGFLTGLNITDGGVLYRNVHSDEAPPIAPDIETEIIQFLPSQGTGGSVDVTINKDTHSPDFGKVSFSLASGGDGYLAFLNADRPVVVNYLGKNASPTVVDSCGSLTYVADEPVANCSELTFDAYVGKSTAHVVPGGEILPLFQGRPRCCGKCETRCTEVYQQVVIHFSRAEKQGKRGVDGNGNDINVVCDAVDREVIWDFTESGKCQSFTLSQRGDAQTNGTHVPQESALTQVSIGVADASASGASIPLREMTVTKTQRWGCGYSGLFFCFAWNHDTKRVTVQKRKELEQCGESTDGWEQTVTESGEPPPFVWQVPEPVRVGEQYGAYTRVCEYVDVSVSFQ